MRKNILGLSEREAAKRLSKYGPNAIFQGRKLPVLKLFFSQFKQLIVLILIASTLISAFMGEMTEAAVIIAIVIVNAFMGFIQEYRTEKTMEALRKLSAPTAKVIRSGKDIVLPAVEIVPGDLIVIEAGDRVPADARLIEGFSMTVDESLLTGESIPVEKNADSFIYMGTVITGGRGRAFVAKTGMSTEMGRIAGMISEAGDAQTPLQKRLEHLGRLMVYICLFICSVVSVIGVIRGEELFTMFLAGISLAVAAIPEGLPAVVTIALTIGVQRMLKRNALVRKLPAVETLGCATVICSDKTGTLTQNKMTVKKLYAGGESYNVDGYAGESTPLMKASMKSDSLSMTLKAGSLCNNAEVFRGGGKGEWQTKGDPTEAAILLASEELGIGRKQLDTEYERLDEIPFDSSNKYMAVICRDRKGSTCLFVKGAPDIVINMCESVLCGSDPEKMTGRMRLDILKANESMANDALRVIAMAYKRLEKYDSRKETDIAGFKWHDNLEGLIFAGMAGMYDPPRKEAAEAVLKCRLAGIKPVMITGDHKATAAAVAREIGILRDGDIVMTGKELDETRTDRLCELAGNVSVYARVSPAHKLSIVRSLKKAGHVVAMTGDGVNDAPAVREADIGISMGISGTDVTREASSMILLDDNFSTIVAAVEEGRIIYNNIRKFIRYLLSCNIGEVLTMFTGMILGLPIVLLPIQILWVNLVTDGLPAIALGLEPGERDSLRSKVRMPDENIFSGGLSAHIIFRGILIALSTLAVFISVQHFTGQIATSRTAAFVTLVVAQLMHVFECKSENKSIFEIPIFNNIFLVSAVFCSTVMILSVVYLPILQPIFKTVPLSINEWALVLGFSSLGPALSGLFRKVRRRAS